MLVLGRGRAMEDEGLSGDATGLSVWKKLDLLFLGGVGGIWASVSIVRSEREGLGHRRLDCILEGACSPLIRSPEFTSLCSISTFSCEVFCLPTADSLGCWFSSRGEGRPDPRLRELENGLCGGALTAPWGTGSLESLGMPDGSSGRLFGGSIAARYVVPMESLVIRPSIRASSFHHDCLLLRSFRSLAKSKASVNERTQSRALYTTKAMSGIFIGSPTDMTASRFYRSCRSVF